MLDDDRFLTAFAKEFDTGDGVTMATGLWDDLGLDSFDGIRCVLWVETISEVLVPLEPLPQLFTVADVYGYYTSLVRAEQRSGLAGRGASVDSGR